MAALRRKPAGTPGCSITISPISRSRSSCASTSFRCRCSKIPTVSSGWPPRASCLHSTKTFFLLLCRDGSNGFGTSGTTSRYRSIELVDTSKATNIAGSPYDGTVPVAPSGKLAAGVVPATLTRYIDINNNAELSKFGLHNGPPNDRNNLSEKWEGMALVPALDPDNPNDFFLFITNDNDFITQNGYQVGAPYKDASGVEVDTMILVYRVTLPVN